jgi:hypothetical protein
MKRGRQTLVARRAKRKKARSTLVVLCGPLGSGSAGLAVFNAAPEDLSPTLGLSKISNDLRRSWV